MKLSASLGSHLRDWTTFPADAALAYRNEGLRGAWKALARRTLHRVARAGRLVVFAQSVEGEAETSLPPGITIAPVKETDWPALATIVGQRELRRFRDLVDNGRHCLVAWRGERPVGYAWVAERVGPDVTIWPLPLEFPADAAYLWNLYVLPSERSNGIGSALAQARLRTARERGLREGWRMVAPSNGPSIRTVQKSGVDAPRIVGELRFIQLFTRTYSRFTPDVSVAVPSVPTAASPRRPLLRRLAGYALSKSTTEALLGVRGVVLALLLGPAAFGHWALVRLAMRYSSLPGVSVYRGLELELLQSDAKGNTAHRDSPAATAFGFVLLAAGTLAGLALAASVVVTNPDYRLLLRGFAVACLAESVYGYALVCTRIRSTLRVFSILETGTALLHVIFAVSLALVWGLPGAFAGLALAYVVGIGAAARWVEFRPLLRLKPLRRLMSIGIPMAFTGAVALLLTTADRWVVTAWGGPTMLGYYAFAASVTTGALALAQIIRTVVFPQVYGEASSAGAAKAIRAHLKRALVPFARFLPPLLGGLSLAIGPLVAWAMPSYVPAIAPARLFLLAGAAMGLVNLASVGAIAAGRQRQLPFYAIIALALTLGLSILALASGYGLGGVAGAAFAGHLVYAAAVVRVNVRETGLADADRFVMVTLLPLIYSTVGVLAAAALFPGTDPASAAKALGLYLLLIVPLLPSLRAEWRRIAYGRN